MGKILVVDDEPRVLASLRKMFARNGYDADGAADAEDALDRLEGLEPDLVILDINLPGMNGLEAFQQIKERRPKLPVIIMTAHGTTENAIEATKLGAFEYLLKPFKAREMLETIDRALESARLTDREVVFAPSGETSGADALVGQSAQMQEVYKAIGRVAASDTTVLIRGETGVGKELVARAVYQHSSRSGSPLLVVNCPALPETLLESELFGHERGAFTGAVSRRIGKFEQANRATIFLDEIGDIPLSVQAKILRVLQDGTFQRIGGGETIRSDVRVIAATNRDLEGMIKDGLFRQDLYHRLDVVTLRIPPLRERREDIPVLVDFFLEVYARDMGRSRPTLSDEAQGSLESHSWPGNVRELRHCIHRALLFSQGQVMQEQDLLDALKLSGQQSPLPSSEEQEGTQELVQRAVKHHLEQYSGPMAYRSLTELVDATILREALQMCDGNQSQAARLLGISRPTLLSKLAKYGIHRKVDYADGSE